jgi:hypothetical protein
MKLKLTAFFLGACAMMISCKFTATPEGIYNGTYTSYGFSTYSGDGTLKIESGGGDLYNVTLISTGNPNIYFSDVELKRKGSLYGNTYEYSYGDYSTDDTTMRVTASEYDYYNGDNSATFDFETSTPITSISFTGKK